MEWPIADVHAHILPAIDDGARDWEESLRMLETAISMGIRVIIATPHYSRGLDPHKVAALARELEVEAKKRCPEFKVYPGQEILYFDSMVDALKKGEALTLAGSRYVLVEFMPEVSYQKLYQGICKLLRGGYYPVVAHAERYGVLRQEENVEELLGTGCLLQMNYSSLKGGLFNRDVRWCRRQVLKDRISLLGTDMHRVTWRSPDIGEPLAWLTKQLEPGLFKGISHDCAIKIIRGGQSGS